MDFIFDFIFWGFILSIFSARTAMNLLHLVREKGLGAFSVDAEGILDRTMMSNMGRIYWPEIKAISPINKFGIFRDGIRLDVTDNCLQKKPARIRRLFKLGYPQISSMNLKASRDGILKVLEDGVRRHELRSISDAKEFESGSEN